MHLYYFPIVLFSYHYRWTGVVLSTLLGALYVFSVTVFTYPDTAIILGAVQRYFVFIGISIVVAMAIVLNNHKTSYQALYDQAKEGILIVGRQDLVIAGVNPYCQYMLGYEQGECIGRTLGEVCKDADGVALTSDFLDKTLVDEGTEVRLMTKDGSERTALLTTGALPENQYVLTLTDITWQIQIENEMKKLEVINKSPVVAFLWHAKEGWPVEIVSTNITLFGYTPDEFLSGKIVFRDIIYPDDLAWVTEEIAYNSEHHIDAFEQIYRIHDSENQICWIENYLYACRDPDGTIIHYQGIIHNITKQKNVENALKMVNKKLNILSNITRHDILNQLTGALGFLELLKMVEDIPPGSDSEKYLAHVNKALETIMHQILFTRDYQDLGVKAPDWQKVGRIIDKMSAATTKELTVNNEVDNLEIYADPLFEKVIFNLLDNAVHHGEKITTIRFYREETPEGLNVVCEDDGAGIPTEVKEKIFNRQYYQHTGLGLFLSREILSITGMTIAETGMPGEGARFNISVPDGMWRSG